MNSFNWTYISSQTCSPCAFFLFSISKCFETVASPHRAMVRDAWPILRFGLQNKTTWLNITCGIFLIKRLVFILNLTHGSGVYRLLQVIQACSLLEFLFIIFRALKYLIITPKANILNIVFFTWQVVPLRGYEYPASCLFVA